jgi:hypothetical protein
MDDDEQVEMADLRQDAVTSSEVAHRRQRATPAPPPLTQPLPLHMRAGRGEAGRGGDAPLTLAACAQPGDDDDLGLGLGDIPKLGPVRCVRARRGARRPRRLQWRSLRRLCAACRLTDEPSAEEKKKRGAHFDPPQDGASPAGIASNALTMPVPPAPHRCGPRAAALSRSLVGAGRRR